MGIQATFRGRLSRALAHPEVAKMSSDTFMTAKRSSAGRKADISDEATSANTSKLLEMSSETLPADGSKMFEMSLDTLQTDSFLREAQSTEMDSFLEEADFSTEAAVVRIQALVRGQQSRKSITRTTMANDDRSSIGELRDSMRKGFANDDAEEAAATRLQAAVRGRQTRKNMARTTMANVDLSSIVGLQDCMKKAVVDDEGVAATRLQAAVRGRQTRKSMARKTMANVEEVAATRLQAAVRGHQSRNSVARKTAPDLNSFVDDDCNAAAATRIQAAFRGRESRKSMSKSVDLAGDEGHSADQQENAQEEADEEEEVDVESPEERHNRELRDATNAFLAAKHVKEESAMATRIQVWFRALMERRRLAKEAEAQQQAEAAEIAMTIAAKRQEATDQAMAELKATQIQAVFHSRSERRDALKHRQSDEIDVGFMGNAISNAAAKIQANFRGRAARLSISAAMLDVDEDDFGGLSSRGDSDGDSDYSDSDDEDQEDLGELLRDFEAEFGDRAYYLSDLERMVYTGGVVRDAGITAIAISLITVNQCRHMEAALAKRGKMRDRIFMQATTYSGGVENPKKEWRGRTELSIMLQAIFDKLPRRRDGTIGYQSPLEMCVHMIYTASERGSDAPRAPRRAPRAKAAAAFQAAMVVSQENNHSNDVTTTLSSPT